MSHHESMFEMDRRIRELEQAIQANDEYLQKVEALNAELLEALKALRHRFPLVSHEVLKQADAAIAKARSNH